MSYNKVIIEGRLGRDPELKYTPKGQAVARFSLAIGRKWKNEAGDEQEETTWVECNAWGKTAEIAGQYMKKGTEHLVEGRLKQENWDDKKTGEKRSKLVVVVDHLRLGPKRGDGVGGGGVFEVPPKPTPTTQPAPNVPGETDSVPF